MKKYLFLTARNIKIFFKDKGMVFGSFVTPLILLVLYVSFLSNIYFENLNKNIPSELVANSNILRGIVNAQLVSSLLAVSAVTISFNTNFLMVQDKADKIVKDFEISPIKPQLISLSYFTASLCCALMILYPSTILGIIFIVATGGKITFVSAILLLTVVSLLCIFGTAISSFINSFLKTHTQMAAVATTVSAGYGFICGAYMPLSSLNVGFQKFMSLLPSTYMTSLVRRYSLMDSLNMLSSKGLPPEGLLKLKSILDINIDFFSYNVASWAMFLIIIISILLSMLAFILASIIKSKLKRRVYKTEKQNEKA